jgi:hypothetical protein
MPDLDFRIIDAEVARYAATPTLNFKMSIHQNGETVRVRNIALQCQIRIETRKRNYLPREQARLSDLFGEPARWGETLQSLLWTQIGIVAPAFEGRSTAIDLPVPCSFDFNIAATKYFEGLEQGEIPLVLLFSGSVFYLNEDGVLAMDPISWSKEANYRLPAEVWNRMMAAYYPNQTWLCLERPVFEALYEYKRRNGYTGFDEALGSLLQQVRKEAS